MMFDIRSGTLARLIIRYPTCQLLGNIVVDTTQQSPRKLLKIDDLEVPVDDTNLRGVKIEPCINTYISVEGIGRNSQDFTYVIIGRVIQIEISFKF